MSQILNKDPRLGAIRELQCPWCTERNRKPTRRLHGYREDRGWVSVKRVWECSACGHRTPYTPPTANDGVPSVH